MESEIMKDNKIEYLQLRELGSGLNMSYSNCEVFAGKIIGLNGGKRKLVAWKKILKKIR